MSYTNDFHALQSARVVGDERGQHMRDVRVQHQLDRARAASGQDGDDFAKVCAATRHQTATANNGDVQLFVCAGAPARVVEV